MACNTIFRDLGLFPHMTVSDNVAYGLKVRGVDLATRRSARPRCSVSSAATATSGAAYTGFPGGSVNAWRFARALVLNPVVLLLDERLTGSISGWATARRDQSSTSAAWRDDCWRPTTGRIRVAHPNEPCYLGPVTSSPLLKTVNAQEGLEIFLRDRHTVERHGHHSIRSRFLALVPFSRLRVTQSLAHRPATSGDRPEVATSSAHSTLPGRPSALVWVWLYALGPQVLNTLTAAHSTAFRPPVWFEALI